MNPLLVLIGFLLSLLVSVLAWQLGALSRGGALAATLTGGLIFGLGGLDWAALLLTFFISSSALSRLFTRQKVQLNEKFSKGSRRDAGQVLANGGLGALLGILHAAQPQQAWPWIAFIGTMAAVNADTWATELGVLSQIPPRLITTGQMVDRGTSGAISTTGILASMAGAALVSLMAALFSPFFATTLVFILGILGGVAGSLCDSFLGATVQAIYYCPTCQKETERYPRHTCDSETIPLRGWHWLDNDLVNIACSLTGALVTLGLWRLLFL